MRNKRLRRVYPNRRQVTLRGILEVILKVYEESGGVDGWDSVIFGLVFDGLMLWNIFDLEMNPLPLGF